MQDKLFIQLISCDGITAPDILSCIESAAPHWYLHGGCILHATINGEEINDDKTPITSMTEVVIGVYSEGEFIDEETFAGMNYCCVKRMPTDKELDYIERVAAVDAIKTSTVESNIEILGDGLLNKHPECRKARSLNMAIISAALKERSEAFSNEDYLEYE